MGNPVFSALASHIVWNFEKAKDVTIGGSAQVPGMILVPTTPAPTATTITASPAPSVSSAPAPTVTTTAPSPSPTSATPAATGTAGPTGAAIGGAAAVLLALGALTLVSLRRRH